MTWMIYGANGYTGRLIAEEAVNRGMKPVLAGRNREDIESIGERLGLETRVFSLEDPEEVHRGISGMKLVLHCAGPFSRTSAPMVDACLKEGAHYLDITGEIGVFSAAHERDDEARRLDVVLLPGAGFDVVPTDCLAAILVEALPAATSLQLAFEAAGGPSPGTAKTSVEGMASGGRVRRDGKLVEVPLGWKTRKIPFAHGERHAVTIPWGDVYTAYLTTGIPDIEVYISASPASAARLKRLRWVRPLLALQPVQEFMKKRIAKSVKGPSGERRDQHGSQLWGEVKSADGRTFSATMTTPNGYDLTVTASLGIVQFLLENEVEGGYYTPSLLMGSAYAESLPGVTVNR
jgi:short subunit dehydrogenase-like uncharacterized protein